MALNGVKGNEWCNNHTALLYKSHDTDTSNNSIDKKVGSYKVKPSTNKMTDSLAVMYTNARSIRNKLDELKVYIAEEDLDIIYNRIMG